MTTKDKLVYMIKHKGSCIGIQCSETSNFIGICPFNDKQFHKCNKANIPIPQGENDIAYENCINLFLEKYGTKEEIVEILL